MRLFQRRRRDDERGLVLVYFAMSLTLLLVASAFTVDVGAWYRRAEQIQRAADAAAMAGTTYLPNDPLKAMSTAVDVAAKNGFTDGANGGTIHVSASLVSGQSRQLQVDITDDHLPQYFSQTFYGGTSAHRKAIAAYAPPIRMGSPVNSFGLGTEYTPTTGNFFAAVDGYCSPREQGDLIMAHSDGEYVGPFNWNCSASTSDTYSKSYDPHGYDYQVEIAPAPRSSKLLISVYDPAFVPWYYDTSGNIHDCTGPDPNPVNPASFAYSIETTYTITRPDGTVETPNVFTSTESATAAGKHGDAADCDKYVILDTLSTTDPGGTYTINVQTTKNEPNSFGSNVFGLLVVPPKADGTPNTGYHCTTVTDDTCPQVHATTVMSIYMGQGKLSGQVYLAQIDTAYAGHTLNVSVWDPGEGGKQIQILDDGGAVMPFSYTVYPCSPPACTQTGTTVTALDVSGTAQPQPGTNRVGDGTYNDRLVTLSIKIPSTYTADKKDGWWSLKYDFSGAAPDRTTWAIATSGSPVHLVNG